MTTNANQSRVTSSIDPFSDAYFADPYRFQEELREAGPVVWIEKYGIWAMARYHEVYDGLQDWATFISGAGAGLHDLRREKAWRPPSIVLEADPPLHDVTRGVMTRVLSGPAIKKLRAAFEVEAERLAEELVARGTFDAVSDFAVHYPLKVVGDAVGLPEDGRECLLPFSNMLFNSFGPENEIFRTSVAEAEHVMPELYKQCERESLSPGSFGEKIYEAADAGKVSHEQAGVLVRSILSAGFDTTVNGLSNSLYAFATYPDQWDLVRADPALQRSCFDEVLRWESSVQVFFRTTSRPVEVAGTHIESDQKVVLFLASANRDPRRWTEPDRFDVTRNTAGHLGFGSGIHVCVGQMMAKLEAELLFAALAKRVERFELVGEPVRRPNNTLRGFASCPVRVHPVQ